METHHSMRVLFFAAALLALPTTASQAGCSPHNPEPFATFLQRFSTKSAFALKRTILPLQMLKWEYGVNEQGEDESAPVRSLISKSDYLKWPTLNTYMESNNLTSAMHSQTRTKAVLKVFKDGTDWQTLYHFKSKSGCWYFWQYEDQSL